MVKVRALKNVSRYLSGDVFETSDAEAKVLILLGIAELASAGPKNTTVAVAPKLSAAREEVEDRKVLDDSVDEEFEEADSSEDGRELHTTDASVEGESRRSRRKKREYRRRDMVAE